MKKIGDFIVYKHDVCEIIDIKEKYLNSMDYYILSPILDKSLQIRVPVDSTLFRSLISKDEVQELINKIPSIPPINANDKLLETEYKNLLRHGTHEDLIKIIKTTYLRNQNRLENKKKIGEKDQFYFNKAEEYLYHEFAIILGITIDDVKDYITENIKKEDKC